MQPTEAVHLVDFGGSGAGLWFTGKLTMTYVTVSNNTTGDGGDGGTGRPGGFGAGMNVVGTISMTHCFVTGNSTGNGEAGSNAGALAEVADLVRHLQR